jgi:hypothetical protein
MLHALTELLSLLNFMVPVMPSDTYNLGDFSNDKGIKQITKLFRNDKTENDKIRSEENEKNQ